MSFFSWLRNRDSSSASGRFSAPRLRTSRRRPTRSYRPRFETLEDRVVLSTFHVTTDLDGGAGSLRAAIIAANARPGADTIRLPAGIYNLTLAGAGEDQAATGDLDITDQLTIRGAGAATTVIDAGGLDRVFQILGAQVKISDVTIQSGNAGTDFGGGISSDGTLTVRGSILSGNSATLGGGIYNASGGTLTVKSSSQQEDGDDGNGSNLSGNSAINGGGGIYNEGTATVRASTLSGNSAFRTGGILNFGALTVRASTLFGNLADYEAGGIYNGGTLTVSGSTLSGNSATFGNGGGGILNEGGTATVRGSTLSGNSATFGEGGGGISNYGGTLTVIGSNFTGNSAGDKGGGIYNSGLGILTVRKSTLSSNSAIDGGGIYNQFGGTATVSDSTLSGNSAAQLGGGIYNDGALTVSS